MPRGSDPNEEAVDLIFKTITHRWLEIIKASREHKRNVFGATAAEIETFYRGPRDTEEWDKLMVARAEPGAAAPNPRFKVSVNKAFEYVQIFGPALYYESPVRTVKPRMPVDVPYEFLAVAGVDPATYQSLIMGEQARVMADGLRATLIGAYLNWTPHEFGLAEASRMAIDEALIKGRSCIWTEVYSPPGANYKVVRSVWDSVNNLFIDPDASSVETAKWIAMRCVHPVWEVERTYGLPRGSLRANAESLDVQSSADFDEHVRHDRTRGQSNDLLVYYKIWSKMGIGGRFPNVPDKVSDVLEMFGDYAYLVVADGSSYPLNLPPSVVSDPAFAADPTMVFERVEWPVPFWAADTWPVSLIEFCRIPNSVWPMSPLKSGLPELRFLNWAISFLTGHVHVSSRVFLAMLKSLGEDIRTQILEGQDMEMLELSSTENRPIEELIQFLKHPELNKDLFEVIEKVEALFDKRVGLTELMYGNSGVQIRSAEEASIKQQNMSVRPEDMAKQVESWQAEVAAKESMAARRHLGSEDVRPVLGPIGAWAWTTYCSTEDAHTAARQLEYHIESGSTQKPNKQFEIRQMTEAFQSLGPVFQAHGQMTGDMTPMNNLLSDFAKSRDLDPLRYQLLAPMPSPMPDQAAGGPGAVQQEPTDNPPVGA